MFDELKKEIKELLKEYKAKAKDLLQSSIATIIPLYYKILCEMSLRRKAFKKKALELYNRILVPSFLIVYNFLGKYFVVPLIRFFSYLLKESKIVLKEMVLPLVIKFFNFLEIYIIKFFNLSFKIIKKVFIFLYRFYLFMEKFIKKSVIFITDMMDKALFYTLKKIGQFFDFFFRNLAIVIKKIWNIIAPAVIKIYDFVLPLMLKVWKTFYKLVYKTLVFIYDSIVFISDLVINLYNAILDFLGRQLQAFFDFLGPFLKKTVIFVYNNIIRFFGFIRDFSIILLASPFLIYKRLSNKKTKVETQK